MKRLKQLFAVTLLVLTLGIPAFAGDMGMPGITNPPPPPPPSASVAGEMNIQTAAAPALGDMEVPTLVTMELESILGVLALCVY
jgi:hypothetical protein